MFLWCSQISPRIKKSLAHYGRYLKYSVTKRTVSKLYTLAFIVLMGYGFSLQNNIQRLHWISFYTWCDLHFMLFTIRFFWPHLTLYEG